MGYTHYWRRKLVPEATLRGIIAEMAAVCAEASRTVDLDVQFRSGLLRFNGPTKEGCEDFVFPGSPDFDFCKTRGRPYDVAVTACLALAAHRLGDSIEVTSDGTPGEWEAGCALASEVIGEPVQCPPGVGQRE